MYKKLLLSVTIALTTGLILTSCDDETGTLGINTMPSTDQTHTSQAIYNVLTKSILIDSLAAYTSDCYLGRVTDPETNSTTTCDFMAQFATLEGDELPPIESIHKENGSIVADSVELNIYIKSYYGDSLNSMKIGIYELDTANVIPEGQNLYTDIDPTPYLNTKPGAVSKETTFAVADLNIDDTIRYASSYSKHISIKLPAEYGTRILQLYYTHPEYFNNSYNLLCHVTAGFYVRHLAGNGTMISIDLSTITIFFRYTNNGVTYNGLKRIAATGEVIQCNRIQNTNLLPLLDATEYTYLKTPMAILTEVEMPLTNIFSGHENDTISSAQIVLQRYSNASAATPYTLPVPQKLLMVPKAELHTFFAQRRVPDNTTTFTAEYSSANNSYTFTNIAPLISKLRAQKKTYGSDWNKVVLVPVITSANSTGAVISVTPDHSLGSAKLLRSTDEHPLTMTVIYSTFSN